MRARIGMVAALALCAVGARGQEATMGACKVTEKATGAFHCVATPALLATKGAMSDGGAPVQPIQDLLTQRFGAPASSSPSSSVKPPYIVAGLTGDRAELRALAARLRGRLPSGGLGEEGYAMEVTPDRVLLTAAKPAGLYRGAVRLAAMATGDADALDLPCGTYADWPAMAWRGMHVMLGGRSSLPAAETLLTKYAPELGINRLIVEVDYGFAFKSHPEMAEEGGLRPEDCRGLADLARRHYVELIPQINCLGHQSWAKSTGRLLTAHPEFDETPDLAKDNPGIYCRSWCPSNPAVVSFVGDLIDEVVDAFGAKWFHCGMDEVFILGKCPRCKGTDNAALFAKAVNDLHAHLAKRKIGMMIWGDRLLDGKATGYGEWEASENGTAPAITKVPKDILMCDWHYEQRADFPSVKSFQDNGFRVWPSGWNSVGNARSLAGCALRNAGPNMAGYLATTWEGAEAIVSGLGDNDSSKKKTAKDLPAAIRTGLRIAWTGES